jgi:PRTRC genetic system protein B
MNVKDGLVGTQSLQLSRAILIYEEPYAKEAVASVHAVHVEARSAPQILPGRCLLADELVELLHRLQKTTQVRQILPERLLFADAALMLWWLPACRRPLFFKTSDKDFNAAMQGKPVAHPPLLFLARPGHLSVFALAQNERPTASTSVYVAPYHNLYADGHMCRGNVSLPDVLSPSDIERWESLLFETNFTHSNAGVRTRFKGGHNALWKHLARYPKVTFRAEWLLDSGKGLTVGDLLRGEEKKGESEE